MIMIEHTPSTSDKIKYVLHFPTDDKHEEGLQLQFLRLNACRPEEHHLPMPRLWGCRDR